MNQNYPDNIMEILRQRVGLDEDDTSRDAELQTLTPVEALEECLSWEGIEGYTGWILDVIRDTFKVKLKNDFQDMSKQDFVQGLGNIFYAQNDMDGVTGMRMDEHEQVTVYFVGGGTHKANCAMDSKRAIISDILKQAF